MRVEIQSQPNSLKADAEHIANEEYQALIWKHLLSNVVKDLLEDVQIDKLDVAENQKAKSKKGSESALNCVESKKERRERKTSPDSSNAILEAFIAQIEANASLSQSSKTTVEKLIAFTEEQLGGLAALQQEIQNLEKQLKSNLTQKQVAAILAQLKSLEAEYNSALSDYNSAQNDYNQNQAAANAASQDYNRAQKAYNKIHDKSSPEAIKLKKEMEADQSKEASAHSAMNQDKNKMKTASQTIAAIEVSLSALGAKYPSLKSKISDLISVMNAHGNISQVSSALNAQISAIAVQDQKLESEISAIQVQEQSLIESLSHNSNIVKKALEQFLSLTDKISAKDIMQLLTHFLSSQVVQNMQDHKSDYDKEAYLRVAKKTTATRHEQPIYRHAHQRATKALV